ncbi:uncharacterized protein LOC135498753 [Lineus longissimus]|uniref:uncharacterized protein LOC135498753 n=1 Tax=Lineus longissimus TaxID=88925 RepID=UPI002B4DD699
MEAKSVNILKSMKTEVKNKVVLHRPPSGKPSGSSSNQRNRRLRMPLPPQNDEHVKDTTKAKTGVPVSCPSPPTLPRSPSPFGVERIRPQSATPILSSLKTASASATCTPDNDIAKKPEKVFFSPVVEILNPPTPKVSAFKVNNLQLDLEEKGLPVQSLPEKPLVKKSWGETNIAFGRQTGNSDMMEKFLENSSQSKPKPKPTRPSSALAYSQTQNFGASNSDSFSFKSCKERPASAALPRKSSLTWTGSNSESDKTENVLEPFVFGFKSNKVICGSETDLTSVSTTDEFTPYKMSEPPAEVMNKEPEMTSVVHQCNRNVPQTLHPLIPWLTEGLPLHWTGMDSSDCLMFIPSLQRHQDDLPVVPAPHGLTDELPYKEIILPKETWNPKKYTHPSFKKAPEWQCKHSKTEVRLYNKEGILLYERYQGTRTKNVVRKEIAELEKLMKGIGTDGSDCMVVQLQADITRVRKMVEDTLKLAAHPLFKRPVTPEPTDYFGLRKFYQEHDEIMEEIKQQHSICVQELALIENTMDLDEGLKHFNKVVTLAEAGMS